MLFSGSVFASDYEFDASMVDSSGSGVDMTLFSEGLQQPGLYYVKIALNGEYIESDKIRFDLVVKENKRKLQPCLSLGKLKHYGIKIEEYYDLSEYKENECANLSSIPQFQSEFQFENQLLSLIVPPEAVQKKIKGIARQALWDDGISAFLMNYSFDFQRTLHMNEYSDGNNKINANFEPGVNIGAWRLRSALSREYDSREMGTRWKNDYLYLIKGIPSLKSRMTIGDINTPSDVFDSVYLRGVMLSTDEEMVPYNQRGYSPVINGFANTQAVVIVRQGKMEVYRTTVSAGPFSIADYGTVCSSGEMKVDVIESNGSDRVFFVPCIAPPVALHFGYTRYLLSLGYYDSSFGNSTQRPVTEITAMRGLSGNTTLYSGLQLKNNYHSSLVGVGFMLGNYSGISFDFMNSDLKEKRSHSKGSQLRLRYIWNNLSGFTFTLSNRWLTGGKFNNISESFETYNNEGGRNRGYRNDNAVQQTQAGLSFMLGDYGSLNFNGDLTKNTNGERKQIKLGYSVSLIKNILLNLNVSRTRSNISTENANNEISISLSLPMDFFNKKTWVSTQLDDSSEEKSEQSVWRGTLDDNKLSWNVQQDLSQTGTMKSYSRSFGTNYIGRYGSVYDNYYRNKTVEQVQAGMTGGFLIHSHGITFGQRMDDTVSLIDAPGVVGASVGFLPGAETDSSGKAIINGVTPYQENTIFLDPLSFNSNSEIDGNGVNVVPTYGAITYAKFKSKIGKKMLISLKYKNKSHPPLGTLVQLVGDESLSSIVSEDGRVYLSGMPLKGTLVANQGNNKCFSYFDFTKQRKRKIIISELTCQ